MPDSSQNGHSSAHPLIRPPQGERASRGLAVDEQLLADDSVLDAEASALDTQIAPPPFEVKGQKAPLVDAPPEVEPEDEAFLASWSDSGNGGEPPYGVDTGESSGGSSGDPNTPRDQELGLMAHLGELRSRILYCVVVVGFAMILTWNKCLEISEWFARPIKESIKGKGELISTDPTGFFTIYLQISLVSALLITMPFLLFQIWRFIEPALTNKERKFTIVLVPFSSALFFLGCGMGYVLSPMFFKFFLAFQPADVAANWNYFDSVVLLAKTILIFGLAFQVPVITIFLNKAGLVSRNFLIEYWRHAVVIIFVAVAFVTPTWDPVTMTACALPPCLFYLLSIWLVKWL